MPPVSLGTITNNTPPPAALALRIANSTAKETGYESIALGPNFQCWYPLGNLYQS